MQIKSNSYAEIEKMINDSTHTHIEIYKVLDDYYAMRKLSKTEYFELLSKLDISE